MDSEALWKQKIVQFFHDPPGKPFAWYPGTGGHRAVGKGLFERFTGKALKYVASRPDWAASGADRPLLLVPRGNKQVQVRWTKRPLVTHPLTGSVVEVSLTSADAAERPQDAADILSTEERSPWDILADQQSAADGLAHLLDDWDAPEALHRAFIALWRRFREELVARNGGPENGDPLWEVMPAESRCPDHSIWDHLRATTAIAFLDAKRLDKLPPAQAPWLLRVSLGPVQSFIAEARSSRDLWLGSFLLADLAWHAMLPVVEHYGPDAVLYPDLCRNPRADSWLLEDHRDALPEWATGASFAAVLPSAFSALVPRGGAGGLPRIEALLEQSRERMTRRWHALAEGVEQWLSKAIGEGPWQAIWARHHRTPPIGLTWSAVAWDPPEPIESAASLRGPALPAQSPEHRRRYAASEADREPLASRAARLKPWMDQGTWVHYERARDVAAHTHLHWHQVERGFDYALTHHQLLTRHALRKQAGTSTPADSEVGEKCTQCGRRQALTNGTRSAGLDAQRKAARELWSHPKLDPDRRGAERLCGVCAMRRFLVEGGARDRELSGLNRLWAGPEASYEAVEDRDGEVRVPFPSTATLAAQAYLLDLAAAPSLHPHLSAVVDAYEAARLPRTGFSRALPRLAAAARRHPVVGRFLMLDTQNSLFPETLQVHIDRATAGTTETDKLDGLQKEVSKLREAAAQAGIQSPGTRIALIRMDGDQMGGLLLGARERIAATWSEVLHPEAVEKIQENEHLLEAGWGGLLSARRLTGPALHAFISRALAEFSHRVVPWVVEREYAGRLIYAGGDDLLCLAPADQALELAARLQQLFTAPWTVDSDYQRDPWAWRGNDWDGEPDQARDRLRFVIPAAGTPQAPIPVPLTEGTPLVRHVSHSEAAAREWPVRGPLLPMLGGQSLSAGIVIAHYKTHLGTLLRHSEALLKGLAKRRAGRNALAVSHYSRNGVKGEVALRWAMRDGVPTAQARLRELSDAFGKGTLPKRLPYKLREAGEAVVAALMSEDGQLESEAMGRLMRGLVDRALDGRSHPLAEAVVELWRQGFRLHDGDPARATDGLLLCRSLASRDEED